MKERIEKFLRTYVIPVGATVLAYLWWRQYECQGAWWWIAAIGAILALHYFFYYRKKTKAKLSTAVD